jgi:hypothetical protein
MTLQHLGEGYRVYLKDEGREYRSRAESKSRESTAKIRE